ncbi:hypothetical protein TNCV_4968291 [Trichonephila clavipes]|nr:hypothetical protein TNCV_4968291 [Trichonephila clavipes]
MTHSDIPIFYGYNAPSRRGNVPPFARVRPQRWGKKDAFHQIRFLVNSKNRANVKTAIITLGTGDLPSILKHLLKAFPSDDGRLLKVISLIKKIESELAQELCNFETLSVLKIQFNDKFARIDSCQKAISETLLLSDDGEHLFAEDLEDAEIYREKVLGAYYENRTEVATVYCSER